MSDKLRPIAIYLPQFHPVPENDEWWGKGFTEWTNVTKAKPLFNGHYQPHLPADLGFYDLRLAEVREQQAQMAKQYGIYGFCYYHYWFQGKRILERPFEEVFESGKPDFPFMLCWANESWTKVWEDKGHEVLIEQKYSEEDHRNHINYLLKFFLDKRYIRVDNKPVISVYNSTSIPDVDKMIQIWREEGKRAGLELYICRFESFDKYGKKYLQGGFDAAIDFQPFGMTRDGYMRRFTKELKKGLLNKSKYLFHKKIGKVFSDPDNDYWSTIRKRIDYNDYVDFAVNLPDRDYKYYPGITPGWDNTARKNTNPFIMKNSTPEAYYKWLKNIVKRFRPYSKEENFIFINAWNEWAEGNHLEPCQKWGTKYLEATKQVFEATEKEMTGNY